MWQQAAQNVPQNHQNHQDLVVLGHLGHIQKQKESRGAAVTWPLRHAGFGGRARWVVHIGPCTLR